ncbi:energy transducer TonB family protein [Marinicella litoralis]|uniref:Outer membrane transport energization protein TonB n=2 Tax=Marinicella litoralis TaxID=644220 RepID=A0A4R6XMD7_9GAMM|nr:TonB family protein [Marinicella litoralis]TDR19529.1 outer membrane transport energization protein TonB [Marinicella litoralis]
MTLTLALLTLSLIILGVSFRHKQTQPEVIHSMDVILSKKSNPEAPDDAEYLAQNNQIGGGTKDKKSRPTNLFSATSMVAEGQAKQETHKQQKQQTKQYETQLITAQQSALKIKSNQPNKDKNDQVANKLNETKEQRLAKIKDEIARKIENYAKKPRSKYVSSSTKAYEFAPYINNWVRKVERTGDLNYPEQAKNKSFIGNVMLTVGINKDGSIHEIKVIKSSDYNFLDEAAKHIVKLAQPFDPLPESNERVDILYITRTWQFLPGHLLRQK